MDFKSRLKKLRTNKNLTQEELATIFNKTANNISQYETGKREPDISIIKEFSKFFGVTIDYLLGNSNDPTLSEKEEKDVAKAMDKLKAQLQDGNDLYFDGEPMDEITIKLLLEEFERQERMVKTINRKYTPKKYRKE